MIRFELVELQSTLSTSENTSQQLKVSSKFIKHFGVKLYVNIMKVSNPMQTSILIHCEATT